MSMFNEEQMAQLGFNPKEVSELQKTADEAAKLQAEEARRQEDNARIGFVFSAKVLRLLRGVDASSFQNPRHPLRVSGDYYRRVL